jgi:hypothetical protein
LTRRRLVFDVYVERQLGLFQAAPVLAAPHLSPNAHR